MPSSLALFLLPLPPPPPLPPPRSSATRPLKLRKPPFPLRAQRRETYLRRAVGSGLDWYHHTLRQHRASHSVCLGR
eukprot:2674705-Rhodomonas_salina.1